MSVTVGNAQKVHRDMDPIIKHSHTASREIRLMTTVAPAPPAVDAPSPASGPLPTASPLDSETACPMIHLCFLKIFTETPVFVDVIRLVLRGVKI